MDDCPAERLRLFLSSAAHSNLYDASSSAVAFAIRALITISPKMYPIMKRSIMSQYFMETEGSASRALLLADGN